MLVVEGLTKKFGGVVALENVSLSLKAGEIFALIGPNGSGKTTLIKCIAGLLHPHTGTIRVDRVPLAEEPVRAKSKMGYIPDDPVIWPGMTGLEFLSMVGSLYGIPRKTSAKRIPELLALFRLEDMAYQYFDDYSRGNRQKFSILAALLHQPKLLLIDEPMVGLDPASAAVASKLFVSFAKEGGTILLAIHTLSVAQAIASRIGILREGRLTAHGSLSEILLAAHLPSYASLDEAYLALTRS